MEGFWKEEYAAAVRRAFERHVLELVRSVGPIQDAAGLDAPVDAGLPLFVGAHLKGEYPETSIVIRTYDRVRREPRVHTGYIWDDEERGKTPVEIASEMLMHAQGG